MQAHTTPQHSISGPALLHIQARAVKRLLAHRLPDSNSEEAKLEWINIVEGRHSLWQGVSEPYKHMIRAFLVHFQLQILSQGTREFDFRTGSIGEDSSRPLFCSRKHSVSWLPLSCSHTGVAGSDAGHTWCFPAEWFSNRAYECCVQPERCH